MDFFHFIKVTVSNSGGIFKFSGKLPAKAYLCCGLFASADTSVTEKSLAGIAVNFNSGKGMTVNSIVDVPLSVSKKSYPLIIQQSLENNMEVTGYVHDHQNSLSYPYEMKIYFHLKSEE